MRRGAGTELKLTADPPSALATVTSYGPGFIAVNETRYTGHLIIAPQAPVAAWNVTGFDALRADDFAALLPLAPEVVVLGTGARQRLPHPRLLAALTALRIGVEAMDTAAACRTYNILMSEGRRVVAVLLQEPAAS